MAALDAQSQNSSQPKDRLGRVVSGKIRAERIRGIAVWRQRSPVRSDDQLGNKTAPTATANGTPERTDESDGRRPEALCTVVGSHKKNPWIPTLARKITSANSNTVGCRRRCHT